MPVTPSTNCSGSLREAKMHSKTRQTKGRVQVSCCSRKNMANYAKGWPEMSRTWRDPRASPRERTLGHLDSRCWCLSMRHDETLTLFAWPLTSRGGQRQRVSQSHRHLRKMTNTSNKARQRTKHTNTAVFGSHSRLHRAQLLKVLLKVFFPQFYLHNQISITHKNFRRCSHNRFFFIFLLHVKGIKKKNSFLIWQPSSFPNKTQAAALYIFVIF